MFTCDDIKFKEKAPFLNVKMKLKILKRLTKGKSGAALAKMYRVGTSTTSEIKSSTILLQNWTQKKGR